LGGKLSKGGQDAIRAPRARIGAAAGEGQRGKGPVASWGQEAHKQPSASAGPNRVERGGFAKAR